MRIQFKSVVKQPKAGCQCAIHNRMKFFGGTAADGPIDGDMHQLRPIVDYPIWHLKLPEGYVMMDTIRIDFPNS